MTSSDLRAAREKLRLTQTALAERLGMTRAAIAKMEAGERPVARVTELAIEHLSCRRRAKARTLPASES